MPENKITWSTESLKQIGKAIEYIRQDSVQNAENVYSKLIKKLDKVAKNPLMCHLINSKKMIMAIFGLSSYFDTGFLTV